MSFVCLGIMFIEDEQISNSCNDYRNRSSMNDNINHRIEHCISTLQVRPSSSSSSS